MDINEFGKRLKELRDNKSQADAAKMIFEKTGISITAQTLGRYEKGKRKPDVEVIEALANTFNVSADYLLCRTDIKTVNTDIKAICKYTGLNEAAVKRLHHLWYKDYNDFGEFNEIYLGYVSDLIIHEDFETVLKLINVTKSRRDNAGNITDDNEDQAKRIIEESRDMLYSAGYMFIHKDNYDRMMKQDIKDKLGEIANSIIEKNNRP